MTLRLFIELAADLFEPRRTLEEWERMLVDSEAKLQILGLSHRILDRDITFNAWLELYRMHRHVVFGDPLPRHDESRTPES